jgi:hypothetical protein
LPSWQKNDTSATRILRHLVIPGSDIPYYSW